MYTVLIHLLNKIARDGIFYGKRTEHNEDSYIGKHTLYNFDTHYIIIWKTLLIREKKKGKEVEGEQDRNRGIKFP